MKEILGFLMVCMGVVFGVWAGLWWAFIGGIIDIIAAIRAPDLVAMDVAFGVVKIMFAGFIGWVCGAALALPGIAMMK